VQTKLAEINISLNAASRFISVSADSFSNFQSKFISKERCAKKLSSFSSKALSLLIIELSLFICNLFEILVSVWCVFAERKKIIAAIRNVVVAGRLVNDFVSWVVKSAMLGFFRKDK
jgi:uncharacterized membrane protein